MEAFSALLDLCAGNSPVTDEFPSQRPVTRTFDVFFDMHLNKRLSKQSTGRRLETPSRSLWRQCNGYSIIFNDTATHFEIRFYSNGHLYWRPIFMWECPGHFKNAYEFVNLGALKLSFSINCPSFNLQLRYFCGISKGTFEISHKISKTTYIEKCD